MLKEKALIRQFFLGHTADSLITMAALSTQRASELNPLIEDESMLAIKMGIICVVILLYALAKDKHLSWQRPLEQGVQLGTVLVWVVVLSNLFTVSSTL